MAVISPEGFPGAAQAGRLCHHKKRAGKTRPVCVNIFRRFSGPQHPRLQILQHGLELLQQLTFETPPFLLELGQLLRLQLHPLAGLTYVWNTLRECDMVTIGTMSTYEAEEVIEISLACLEHRQPQVELQVTRSKKALVE